MGLYAVAFAVFISAVVGAFSIGFGKGSSSRNGEIASLTAAIETSKRLAADAEAKHEAKAAEVVTLYKDRVKTIREVTPGEVQIVERVVREAGVCELPPSFRILWNGGAAPDSKNPKDSLGTDGAPVTVAEIAAGVAEAKRRFDENAARLEALQELVKAQ